MTPPKESVKLCEKCGGLYGGTFAGKPYTCCTPPSDKSEELKHDHSIYDICHSCGMKGVNLPDNRKCGNCGSSDTTRYYPEEYLTRTEAALAEAEKALEFFRNQLNYVYETGMSPADKTPKVLSQGRVIAIQALASISKLRGEEG